ncbi:3-hydroxyisobutyrate dehydrogenase [Streptomyces sp. NPDC014892]|uniref:3-hydroxyisobutyrate dehydrogenase n=1 Tax=Streptomyces sp. NPDC014892 TaxID=3364930 RepID=UPI0037032030
MKICWVGLGRMGLPMVSHLRRAGFDVHVHDISAMARAAAEEDGLTVASSLADAARGADVVFTMLPTGDHVRKVLLESGTDRLVGPRTIFVDSSTISPSEARAIARDVERDGRQFLDAPVSGGTEGAADGTLTFMVGGAVEAFEQVRPLLAAMGKNLFHLGGTGCGQSAKTVNNMMLAMNMASLSEAVVLAERLDLDARTFLDVARTSSGDSWVLRHFYPIKGTVPTAPVNQDFAPGFTASLMRKDVGLALDAARSHEVRVPMTHQAAELLDRLIAAGQGQLDFTALVKLASGEIDSGPDTLTTPAAD